MAKTQIKNYTFKPGIGANDNLFPDAFDLITSNIEFIKKETVAYVQTEYGFSSFGFSASEIETEVEQDIQALLTDIRYGGNSNTFDKASLYWEQDTAQIAGSRNDESDTLVFVKNLIVDFILDNEIYDAENTEEAQVIDTNKNPDPAVDTRIAELFFVLTDVLLNGLGNLPAKEPVGVGHIVIQGQHDLEDILLITNVTKNEIIFNFADPGTGGIVDLQRNGASEEFATYLQITDAVTKITLNYDTSAHAADDELQIFIEYSENGKSVVTTRPFDFGTDAIERMRVATPYSMLDADFEYGLQPTKWAAIGTLRGYPSIYEIAGTDTPVSTIVTDASAGTEGIGQSLITVTTIGPHGFSPGTPVTIKALEDSINGAARAEGSFIITTVPTDNTFTYFAKSKVGQTPGEVLASSFTQLREAGFYTGANVGSPSINIASQGSAGTLTAELDIQAGETVIPYDGPTPEIGAPLTGNDSIALGTQITGTIEQSAGGGVYLTPVILGDYPGGTAQIAVEDPTGIVIDLAADNGAGNAIFVTNITSNVLDFSQGFNGPIIGNRTEYNGVIGTNVQTIGQNAVFDVSKANGIYTTTLVDGGSQFVVGDRLLILGDDIGGSSPNNDLLIFVDSVSELGEIQSFTATGEAFDGNGDVFVQQTSVNGGEGSGAAFDVTVENNEYTSISVTSPDLSQDYIVGDVIRIPGNNLSPFGVTPENDITIEVTAVGNGGGITGINFSGTAPDAQESYVNPPFTYTGLGTGLNFAVERNGNIYNLILTDGGINFQASETITVAGTDLGGTSPANDLTITIDAVDASGTITDFTLSGTAVNTETFVDVSGNNLVGTGATFNITLSDGSYTEVEVIDGGEDYTSNQTITILGEDLLGTTPENDLVIDIVGVGSSGEITSAAVSSGIAVSDAASFTNITPEAEQPSGSGASFNVLRTDQTYVTTVQSTGQDYKVGNRILISGSSLGGSDGIHDLVLRVLETGESGGVLDDSSAGIEEIFDQVVEGTNLDLISTVTISEPTTDILQTGDTIDYELIATLELVFATAHGLPPGSTFSVEVESDTGANNHTLAAGSFFVSEIPDLTVIRYTARAGGFIDIDEGNDPIIGTVYPRPDSFFIHRPFDGGVQLGTGGPQHGAQAVRQSKKYIRYQSGKGIMYTTGALFAPSYDLRSVEADGVEVGSLITVTTDDNDHGVQEGGIIRLLNIETPGYTSGPETAIPPEFDYEVVNVIDERTFQVRSKRRLGSTTATLGFGAQMSVISWHGATVRSGIFDDQNGIFWEYDGTQISVVQRTSTFQIAGTLGLTVDNNLVTGTNTRLRDQLRAGDKIVIKGMTHVISQVISQTEMTVTPDWRGVVDVPAAKGMLVRDKKVKQADFNIDRLDGTGPSGYDIDIAKMQMIGIQYSWYGAGFIDFMVRGADGNFVYAHRMRNSNVNTEAFMRSGNLPVRYEVINEGPPGKLAEDLSIGSTELELEDSSFFPQQGTLYIDNEIIEFTGNNKSENKLTGLIRGTNLNNFQAGATRSYSAGDANSHLSRTGVILVSNTITPLISHWGSAFITDGQFDDDRGYIFSYNETGLEVSTIKQTAFMIRLAPSVSNALIGNLGERELLNRAQLLLQGIEITSDGTSDVGNPITGGIVVEGILNPKNYPENPDSVIFSGLSSQSQGGQPSFAQIAAGGSIEWTTSDEVTTVPVDVQDNIQTVVALDPRFNQSNDDDVYCDTAAFNASGVDVGDFAVSHSSGAGFPSGGLRIRRIRRNFRGAVFVEFDDDYSGRIQGGDITFERRTSTNNSTVANLNQTSFNSSGAVSGTDVTGGSVNFPAATQINTIQEVTFGSTTYYRVGFNNTFDGTLQAGTGTVEFSFSQPPFAEPGETVFSFIATPGERADISLDSLKELTNTPLGGRGTYPNGPDVLAINVFKTTGDDAPANIILRWGEAQA